MKPGEVYLADFDVAGRHPVIVVSRDELNRGRYAVVVVCTSARYVIRRALPQCVPFAAGEFGLTVDCVAQCENMLSIKKTDILDLDDGPIGVLDDLRLRDIIKAIGYVLDSDCEPS